MIELRGTKADVIKQFGIIHGVSNTDRIVVCFFLEDEYKRKWEKPIDKLWYKITPTEVGKLKSKSHHHSNVIEDKNDFY
jgi:hypothetical protein